MSKKTPPKNALILVILLLVVGFGAFNLFKGDSSSSSKSKSDCFTRVSQEIARREGNSTVNHSDIARYQGDLLSRCGE
jgi:hypothetical protein